MSRESYFMNAAQTWAAKATQTDADFQQADRLTAQAVAAGLEVAAGGADEAAAFKAAEAKAWDIKANYRAVARRLKDEFLAYHRELIQ